MSYSLRGSCFGGQPSLGGVGGWWDDLTGGGSSGSSGNFTSCPVGYAYQYNPSTNSGTCVPYEGTRVSIDGNEVPASSTVVQGGCPKGFTRVQFSPTYSECYADPMQMNAGIGINTPDQGHAVYLPGSTSQVPTAFCPKGYTLDLTTGKCEKDEDETPTPGGGGSVVVTPKPGGGTTTPKPVGTTPTPVAVSQATIGDGLPLAAAALLLVGGVYLASRNKRMDRRAV